MIQTPWAVLLCKFKDDSSEPYDRQRYEDLFTSSGVGKLNMVDFFHDMSHGKLDLSGSRVFGWYTIDKNKADYQAGVASDQNKGRNDLIAWARQAAIADLTKFGPFFSVVVCMNVQTDLFGGGNGVVCDDGRGGNGMSSLSPSLLGQEMGHTYGLSHSRADGSTAPYMDPWDVMSTAANTFMAPHPYFTELDVRANPIFRVGPGLNAANMWGRGWLDGSRLWSSVSNAQVNTVVQLRPLHRRDLPGFLAIQLEEYFVEFRINENWDAAIAPTVLVHKIGNIPSEGIVSYLLSDSSGQQAFGAGSFIGMPGVTSIFGSSTRIEVVGIDAGQQFATVRLVHTPAHAPQSRPPDGPYRNPEVAWSDFVGRGDAQVIVDGIVARVSRRSPFFRMLEQIALFENSEAIASVRLQNAVKAEALSTIAVITQEQMHKLQAFRQPAPSLQTEVRDGTISSLEEAFQEHLRPDVKQKH